MSTVSAASSATVTRKGIGHRAKRILSNYVISLNVTADCCGDLDLEVMIEDQTKGLDTAAQEALVTETAQAFNELLPIVPLWECYGNNPAMDGLHICGWLPDDDPTYKNSPYADSFVVIMVMDGTLYPCNQ